MKPILNKWQFVFVHSMAYTYRDPAWRDVRIGIIKIVEIKPEGEVLHRKHYKGFLLEFSYWFPIRPII